MALFGRWFDGFRGARSILMVHSGLPMACLGLLAPALGRPDHLQYFQIYLC